MRIWFDTVKRKPHHSSIFDGDLECRIRMNGQDTDIVFRTSCADEGMREVMVDLLNIGLRNAIEEGNLVQGSFAPRVVQEDPQEDPPETEREDVDSIGEDEGEEQVVHAGEEDPTEV